MSIFARAGCPCHEIRPPEGGGHIGLRVGQIKMRFTKAFPASGNREATQSASPERHRHRGVWQKRFWEHSIRNAGGFAGHVASIECKPVKHRLAKCRHDRPWGSFAAKLARGEVDRAWGCGCERPFDASRAPRFDDIKPGE